MRRPIGRRDLVHPGAEAPAAAPVRMSWARLLKRVFEEIDLDLPRPQCGGLLRDHRRHGDVPVIAQILAISACPPGHRPEGLAQSISGNRRSLPSRSPVLA